MLNKRKPNPVVTELFDIGRKLSISFFFFTQADFYFPKNIRLNSTWYFVMKIPKKR